MINSFKLMCVAILGSILCYFIITLYIIEISIMKYIVIEFIISIFHAIYERVKLRERNT